MLIASFGSRKGELTSAIIVPQAEQTPAEILPSGSWPMINSG